MALIFPFPGYESFVDGMSRDGNFETGDCVVTNFPDGESLVTIQTDVKSRDVFVVCGLEHADAKSMPLLFFAHTAKELGATSVGLIAPYLGYMRQDKRFSPGQAITSTIFASTLSSCFDSLVTLDPHLHRHTSLDKIYTIPTTVLHAAPTIGEWIQANIKNPVLIGPDVESKQWVREVAKIADAPFIVLEKKRLGDRSVEISVPDLSVPDVDTYKAHTPVLIDDIISTAHTMIETVKQLQKAGLPSPVCVGIHGIFVDDAYEALRQSNAARIITTNTITHETNDIDVTPLFSKVLQT